MHPMVAIQALDAHVELALGINTTLGEQQPAYTARLAGQPPVAARQAA